MRIRKKYTYFDWKGDVNPINYVTHMEGISMLYGNRLNNRVVFRPVVITQNNTLDLYL